MSALTPKEAFRFGFLVKCAEDGLDVEGIKARVNHLKVALGLNDIGQAMWTMGTIPLTVGAMQTAGGIGAGMLGGYGAAKLLEKDVDPELAKKYELIAAYRQQADKARRQAARVAYRPTQEPRMSSSY